VERLGDNLRPTRALCEESIKLCPRGFLGVLISKIAGTKMSRQRFPPKMLKFKMAAQKYVFGHYLTLNDSVIIFLVATPMFYGPKNVMKHYKYNLIPTLPKKMLS
jgi:hypothetical protein